MSEVEFHYLTGPGGVYVCFCERDHDHDTVQDGIDYLAKLMDELTEKHP